MSCVVDQLLHTCELLHYCIEPNLINVFQEGREAREGNQR